MVSGNTESGITVTYQDGDGTLDFARNDTSSQSSVNNSNGTVIQDVTLDPYGHVASLTSVDLDGRYYTESEVANHFKTLGVQGNFMNTYAWSGDTSGSANGSGITIQDAVDASTDATILWDATNDEFDFPHSINTAGAITAQRIIGTQSNG